MDGIMLIDKEQGWTSHDVVAKVRSTLKKETGHKVKVGHTGTLDPMATGLLILVVGSYTKKAAEFSKLDKVYQAELTLGAISTTGDKEGEITKSSDKVPSEKEINQAIDKFVGQIMQKPHKFSAIKIDGKRAYKTARKGQEVEMEPRPVTIYEITDIDYQYPKLKFTTKVSSGTYIRSLAEDIGKEVCAGAYLSALQRVEVGTFKLQEAITVEQTALAKITKI
jgi:tRNA pseudouridine55 synthase